MVSVSDLTETRSTKCPVRHFSYGRYHSGMTSRSGADRRRASIPADPRVPAVDQWPQFGIAGQIGIGHLAGEFVLAELFDDGTTYVLHLPEENVFSENGTHIMDDGVSGEMAFATGGMIDLLTTDLNITWFIDKAIVERVSRLYRPGNESPADG